MSHLHLLSSLSLSFTSVSELCVALRVQLPLEHRRAQHRAQHVAHTHDELERERAQLHAQFDAERALFRAQLTDDAARAQRVRDEEYERETAIEAEHVRMCEEEVQRGLREEQDAKQREYEEHARKLAAQFDTQLHTHAAHDNDDSNAEVKLRDEYADDEDDASYTYARMKNSSDASVTNSGCDDVYDDGSVRATCCNSVNTSTHVC